MQRTDSFEKILMQGKIGGGKRRGWQGMRWLDGITDAMYMSLSMLWELVMEQGRLACCGLWGHKELDKTEKLNWLDILVKKKTTTKKLSNGRLFQLHLLNKSLSILIWNAISIWLHTRMPNSLMSNFYNLTVDFYINTIKLYYNFIHFNESSLIPLFPPLVFPGASPMFIFQKN